MAETVGNTPQVALGVVTTSEVGSEYYNIYIEYVNNK